MYKVVCMDTINIPELACFLASSSISTKIQYFVPFTNYCGLSSACEDDSIVGLVDNFVVLVRVLLLYFSLEP